MSETRNVVIIGSGCAGHTAALYTARANLKPLLLEGHEPGGQLSLTTLVENFPGFPEGIQGPELIENMRKQATRFGAEYKHGHVTSADLSQRPFKLHVSHEVVHAKTLIIASGASARWLGLPHEQQLIGHGVSSCATCDGFFFSGKEIAVIGGGDFSHSLCHQGHPHSSSRSLPCVQDHAGSRPAQPENRVLDRHRCRRRLR